MLNLFVYELIVAVAVVVYHLLLASLCVGVLLEGLIDLGRFGFMVGIT